MRVYVAGSAVEQVRCSAAARLIHNAGHEVTSRWLRMNVGQGANNHQPLGEVRVAARHDMEDVAIADALVMLVPSKLLGLEAHSGGRHVEVGFAIALGKRVVIVGEPENIFERCALVASTVEEAVALLSTRESEVPTVDNYR